MRPGIGSNLSSTYQRSQLWLHWVVVVLVVVQWLTSDGAHRALSAQHRLETPEILDFVLINLHLCSGFAVLVLMFWRLRLRRQRPAGVVLDEPGIARSLALWTHRLLYLVLIGLPLSGLLAYYEVLPGADRWHGYAGWTLGGLLALHLAGVLLHLVRQDGRWRRMLEYATDRDEHSSQNPP